MSELLEAIRARWTAAHHDETLVRSLSSDEAHQCLELAIADIHELLKIADVVRAAGAVDDGDDQAFDEASDALWALVAKLSGKAPPAKVEEMTERLPDTLPAPDGGSDAC